MLSSTEISRGTEPAFGYFSCLVKNSTAQMPSVCYFTAFSCNLIILLCSFADNQSGNCKVILLPLSGVLWAHVALSH